MRSCHSRRSWVENEQGQMVGIALGFDFCAEHEFGADGMYATLGVDRHLPGFGAIAATRVPTHVQFEERTVRSPPKKNHQHFKKEVDRDKLKEAVLYVSAQFPMDHEEPDVFKRAEQVCGKMNDLRWNAYDPERDNLQTAWDSSSAIIHVRGARDVERLRELHTAMMEGNLVLNAPAGQGFTRTDGGLSFGVADRFDQAYRDRMLQDHEASMRLKFAAQASGVTELLAQQGKHYHALSPAWMDQGAERELIFFLNPDNYRQPQPATSGYFTVDELKAWAQNTGPAIEDKALDAAFKAFQGQRHTLLSMIKEAGLAQLGQDVNVRHYRACWIDEAHTRLGIEVWPANAASEGPFLAAGKHQLDHLLGHLAEHVEHRNPRPEPTLANTGAKRRPRHH